MRWPAIVRKKARRAQSRRLFGAGEALPDGAGDVCQAACHLEEFGQARNACVSHILQETKTISYGVG